MARRQSDIERESVKDVASRLRTFEDHNLAIKLQEEEFNHHYNRNRSERQVMGVDTRKSKEEQELEKRYALEKRLAECKEIAAKDEAIAKEIQQQLEEEERKLKQEQALIDSELARRMQERYEPPPVLPPPQPYQEDEQLARELQERYFRRLRSAEGSLDEETRNQLNRYIERQTIPPPESLLPRHTPPSEDLGPPPGIPVTQFPPSESLAPLTTFILPANLPPLPSYTEACTPTTPVMTNSIANVSSPITNQIPASITPPCGSTNNSTRASSIRSLSPITTQLLTTTGIVAQPARAILHEIPPPTNASSNYSFIPPTPPSNSNTPPTTEINFNLLQNLHPTNPFKDSLEAEYRANHPDSPLNRNSQNEFGLPPYSDLFHSTRSIARDQQPSSSSGGAPLPYLNEMRAKSNPQQ